MAAGSKSANTATHCHLPALPTLPLSMSPTRSRVFWFSASSFSSPFFNFCDRFCLPRPHATGENEQVGAAEQSGTRLSARAGIGAQADACLSLRERLCLDPCASPFEPSRGAGRGDMYFCRVRYARAQIGLLLAVLSLRATHSFSPAFRCVQSHVRRGFGRVSVRACTQVRVSQVHVRVHACMQLHTHTHTHSRSTHTFTADSLHLRADQLGQPAVPPCLPPRRLLAPPASLCLVTAVSPPRRWPRAPQLYIYIYLYI